MSKTNVKNNLFLDEQAIADFLENVLDRDYYHIYSLATAGIRPKPYGYVASDVDDALDWLEEQANKRKGLYCAVNPPKPSQTRKALREDIKWLCHNHIDVDLAIRRDDPEAEDAIAEAAQRIRELPIPGRPCLTMTGNGVQALWPLATALRATEENRALVTWYNKRIIATLKKTCSARLKVDTCANVDRIVRIPGTPNWPNEKKRKAGCLPVMSELLCLHDREFELDDFNKLLDLPMVVSRDDVRRIDYSRKDYSAEYANPYSWEEFRTEYPAIEGVVADVLRRGSHDDRSTAAWACLGQLCEFLERAERVDPDDFDDSSDLKKNVADMFREGCEDSGCPSMAFVATHYHEHANGWSQLGYDIGNTIKNRMEQGRQGGSAGATRRAERRAAVHSANTVPEVSVSPLEARKAFVDYVGHAISRAELPNCVGAENPSPAQPCTDANVRAVLAAASVTARWDMMRDQVTFRVDPMAGQGGTQPLRPAFHFERAMAGVSAADRPFAEIALVLDALTEVGLRDRRVCEAHIELIARSASFHPFVEYCTAKPWDGVDRVAELVACLVTTNPLVYQYMGVYTRSMVGAMASLRRWLATGAGQQIAEAVVLIGAQGMGKTRFWEMTVPPEFLATGTSLQLGKHGEADSKAACLSGMLCVLNELAQTFDRSQAEALKDFLSQGVDRYRTAYARRAVVKPRMTVFVGTANQDFNLRDVTGNRRYLCLEVLDIDHARLARIDLQQLYAQAWHEVIDEGRQWWLSGEHAEERERQNEGFRAVGEEEMATREYLSDEPAGAEEAWLTARQICQVLNLRYTPSSWHRIVRVLNAFEIEYRARVARKGRATLHRVYAFPVLPEVAQALRHHTLR